MSACGEIHVTITKGSLSFMLEAVVVKELDCEILAGVLFMRTNKISFDIPNNQITIGKQHIPYISKVNTPPPRARSASCQLFFTSS